MPAKTVPLCFWKTEKLAFYSTLSSNFSFMIKVPDYKVHGNKKIYSKGFQNTPNFYLNAFRCVIESFSNLRCFVKNVKFLPEIMKNNDFFRKVSKNIFLCTILCLFYLICLLLTKHHSKRF